MEGKRFDQLARTLATSGSRRRVLGGFLTGVLGGLRIRPASADDSGTTIADASGGDHNHATAAEPGANGNDQDRDHDNGNDGNGGGSPRASQCLCSSETCCGQGEQCCDRFDQGSEAPIGSICCDSDTSCACGDCVPFCEFDEPFAPCDCNCRPGAKTCSLSTEQKNPNTCCREDEDCCRVGGTDDWDAVNVCCPEGTCTPGVGCSTA